MLFWHADDLMLPGTLRVLYERIASDPRLVAVAAAILEDEPRVRHRWPPAATATLARRPTLFAICHAVWCSSQRHDYAHSRRSSCGGFADADSGEDWVLGVSLAFRGRVQLHERPGRVYRARRVAVGAPARAA